MSANDSNIVDTVQASSSEWTRSRSSARTSAADVYTRIRDLIHSGELSPGNQLPPERTLCEMLEVSRVTLRGGLSALRDDGYLEMRRGGAGGTFVSPLDKPYRAWIRGMRAEAGTLDGIMEMRAGIECQIARLAAERRTDADLEDLWRSIGSLDDDIDPVAFRVADSAFHARLALAARNPRLERAMLAARGELFVPASTPMVDRPGIVTTRDEHTAIARALQDRDVAAAEQSMRAHLEQTKRDIAGVLWPGAQATGNTSSSEG